MVGECGEQWRKSDLWRDMLRFGHCLRLKPSVDPQCSFPLSHSNRELTFVWHMATQNKGNISHFELDIAK